MRGPGRLVQASRFLRSRHTLPLRLWLILAVVAITGAGFVAQVTLTAVISIWEQQVENVRLASVRQIIGTDPAQWYQRAWQQHARSSFDALHVEVALYPTPSGQLAYATAGAHGYIDLSAAGSGATQQPGALEFERLAILTPPQSEAARPMAIALLWFTRPPPGEPPQALWPAVALG